MTLSNLWLISPVCCAQSVSVTQQGVDLMLHEWRWHDVMCAHRPVECEERSPPRPRSRPSRVGRLYAQLSGELRDSDGSELICLCCWFLWLFYFYLRGFRGGSLFLSQFIHLCAYFNLSLFPLPICQSVCVWISHSFRFSLVITPWRSVVAVNTAVNTAVL